VNSAIRELGNSYRGTGEALLSSYFAALIGNEDVALKTKRCAYVSFLKILNVRSTKGFRSIEEMTEAEERVLLQIKTAKKFEPETDVNWHLLRNNCPNSDLDIKGTGF
jgi:hypothetical protein